MDSDRKPRQTASVERWRGALVFAVPIAALVVYLYYRWFALLNRHQIFLYYHVMGPGFDTTPFGWVTVSRYWMSGLVAGGAVMIPYAAVNLFLGRVVRKFRAPEWSRLWTLCAVPLLVAIPAIVMTANEPTLSWLQAAQVAGALLAGLALAVGPGHYAANRPVGYLLLMIDGLGLACLLMALRAAEDLPGWLDQGRTGMIHRFLAVLAVGAGLMIAMTAAYFWLAQTRIPDTVSWLVAGFGIHYLFLPLYHHVCWCKDDGSWTDPDYFGYIPDADNYFSRNVPFQVSVWLAVALTALAMTRLRLRLSERRAGRTTS
ncbi:MAG: hypothetical protein PVJ55_07030 [Anaerolineae bacterium]